MEGRSGLCAQLGKAGKVQLLLISAAQRAIPELHSETDAELPGPVLLRGMEMVRWQWDDASFSVPVRMGFQYGVWAVSLEFEVR